ncbi:MAG: CDF family Co(II)/Ni(II) efflux transporter DmeF [Thermoanaerobaculia bacterium]
MRGHGANDWQHSHSFGQEHRRSGERRTVAVIVLTATMMVVEIAAGIAYGSMALLADGLHMASHAAALGITVAAYIFARRHAHDERFSFGTGKINALGGFTGAILLVVFAIIMAWESIQRLIEPVPIAFDQAIVVAVAGLLVNGLSAFILRDHEVEEEFHSHDGGGVHAHHHDHNLAAAYLHVAADALTSLLAIVALFAAKWFGTTWMDPLMGFVAAFLVTRWSVGLLRGTARVLLDLQAPDDVRRAIRECLEEDGSRVGDLHVWSIGPQLYSVIATVASTAPHPPHRYRELLPRGLGIAHVTIEVYAEHPVDALQTANPKLQTPNSKLDL